MRNNTTFILHPALLALAGAGVLCALAAGCGGRQDKAAKPRPDHKERLKQLVLVLRSKPLPEGGFQAVIAACDDEHPLVRARAAEGLGDIRIETETSVAKLTTMLRDPDSEVKAAAAFSLQAFGTAASKAAPDLIALMDGKETPNVRMAAALAAGAALDPATADPAMLAEAKKSLVAMLDSEEDDLKNNAIMALGELKAVEVLSRFVSMMRSEENFFLREACAMAVGKIGNGDPSAVAALQSIVGAPATGNEEHSLRVVAARALWSADPGNELVAPVLVDALVDPLKREARSAREGLAAMGERAAPAVAALLASENEEIRALAAATLGDMGKAAFSALPDLQRVASSDESDLPRRQAREALAKIEGGG